MSHDRLPYITSNSLNVCPNTFYHILCVIDCGHKKDFANERCLMNETERVFNEVGSSFHIDQPGEPKNM